MNPKEQELLFSLIKTSVLAGKEILEIYKTNFDIETKDDNSPLTLADKKSNEIIVKFLKTTKHPILSEEGKNIEYAERKKWKTFWLVDPLDGTKEFIKRNGEFTVNIALIDNQTPIIGVIYVPVSDTLYFAHHELGSMKCINISRENIPSMIELIQKSDFLPIENKRKNYVVVGSKSHMTPETEAFIKALEAEHSKIEMVSKGSSLKLCMVAEGVADIYPRYAPTMEWDTAAGHAIAKYAQAQVINAETKEALEYNKENLLNPWFIVKR